MRQQLGDSPWMTHPGQWHGRVQGLGSGQVRLPEARMRRLGLAGRGVWRHLAVEASIAALQGKGAARSDLG